MIRERPAPGVAPTGHPAVWQGTFAGLDEATKRCVRRAILKAVAVPGCQIPFAGREMPSPSGWGSGGVQLTASLIGPTDVLKVIDQGTDGTASAISIRRFFALTAGIATTTRTDRATVIQTRHRIPDEPLRAGQILAYEVSQPEPLRRIEPQESETRRMHAYAEYGAVYLRLYEEIVRHGTLDPAYDHPVLVAGRYLMSPSPIPVSDNPKLNLSPALHLFGAGGEKRIYAVPPHTPVESLAFSDKPLAATGGVAGCPRCAAGETHSDDVETQDSGGTAAFSPDSEACDRRRERASHRSPSG